MCYYNSVRVKKDDLILLVQEDKKIREYENMMQSGFEYNNCPVVLDKKGANCWRAGPLGVYPLLV